MKLSLSIDIFCEPEKVFSWIDQPEKAMHWQAGVKGGEIIKETPQRIGTTLKEVMEENGKSLIMYGEITDYIPKKSISFRLESRIHKVDVKYSVAGDSSNSIVTMDSLIIWKFPMNFICLFIGSIIKNKIFDQTKAEFAELKRLCENC